MSVSDEELQALIAGLGGTTTVAVQEPPAPSCAVCGYPLDPASTAAGRHPTCHVVNGPVTAVVEPPVLPTREAAQAGVALALTDYAVATGAVTPWQPGEREQLLADLATETAPVPAPTPRATAPQPVPGPTTTQRPDYARLIDDAFPATPAVTTRAVCPDGTPCNCPGCDDPDPTSRCMFAPPGTPTVTTPVPAIAPPPARPVGPPPSTVKELRPVLIAYDASRPRSMQVRLGPSELGTPCQQQIARKLAGAPRQPVTAPTWAPFQGTAVHAEMEHVVAFWNAQLGRTRWLAEDDLQIDAEIRGHGDAYDLDWDTVVDWKHVGTTALKKLRQARRAGKPPAEQVSAEYRVQAHLYGVGHEKKGRPVRHVRLVLLARSWQYDDSDEWTEEYKPEIAFEALTRYYATQDLLNALNVQQNPDFITLVPAAPAPEACKWCPFHNPTRPSGWRSCQGDTSVQDNAAARALEGLIAA